MSSFRHALGEIGADDSRRRPGQPHRRPTDAPHAARDGARRTRRRRDRRLPRRLHHPRLGDEQPVRRHPATAGRSARRRCAAGGGHVEGRADRAPDPRALRPRRAFRGHRGRQPGRRPRHQGRGDGARTRPARTGARAGGDGRRPRPRRRRRRRARHRHRRGRLGLRAGRLRRADGRHRGGPRGDGRAICARCSVSEPLHVTFICSGNICRSPMAEKMFAHQISERGLADEVRVTSAGTGDWHAGEGADNRANRVLREHGYPTTHRAAQINDDHLAADLVVALGRNHAADAARNGSRARPAADAAVVRPAVGCAPARCRRPLLRHARGLRGCLRRHRGRTARVCTPGWTNNSPTAESPADEALVLLVAAALAGLVRRRHRVRLSVLHGAGTVAARQEHQDLPRERADLPIADRRACARDKCSATAGFVGTR